MHSYYLLYRITVGISVSGLMKAKPLYNAEPATAEREFNIFFTVEDNFLTIFMLAPETENKKIVRGVNIPCNSIFYRHNEQYIVKLALKEHDITFQMSAGKIKLSCFVRPPPYDLPTCMSHIT